MSPEESKKVKEAIEKKIGKMTCPICKNDHSFDLTENYLINEIHSKTDNLSPTGNAIVTVPIGCNNCGFISQHVLHKLLN